jgi:hypothetical protein
MNVDEFFDHELDERTAVRAATRVAVRQAFASLPRVCVSSCKGGGKLVFFAARLTSGDGGRVAAVADPAPVVPSRVTACIQEVHITLGQMPCAALERALRLA